MKMIRRTALLAFSAAALTALLICCAAAYVLPEHDRRAKSRAIEHHSLHPPHLRHTFGAEDIPNWFINAATVATDQYIRLTPDRQSMFGVLWNTQPLDLPAWEMVFGFRVHSKSGYGADGMALWIVDKIAAHKGSLFGHPSEFHGIGILFDSYDNDRYRDNPAVHVVYNAVGETKQFNPQQDFRGQSSGTCFFDYRNTPKPTLATARLRFQDGALQVYMSKYSEKDEVLCTTVQGLDLSKNRYFLGVTAETGGITDHHDIHYLHVYPIEGFQYDHDVYDHGDYNHKLEAEQKSYWRAKTDEELAAERKEQEEAQARVTAERERQRKEAEEANKRDVEKRRVAALEKELAEMRKKATEQEEHFRQLAEKQNSERAAARRQQEQQQQQVHQAQQHQSQGQQVQVEAESNEPVAEGSEVESYDGDEQVDGVEEAVAVEDQEGRDEGAADAAESIDAPEPVADVAGAPAEANDGGNDDGVAADEATIPEAQGAVQSGEQDDRDDTAEPADDAPEPEPLPQEPPVEPKPPASPPPHGGRIPVRQPGNPAARPTTQSGKRQSPPRRRHP